jgi:hypothetical protein
MLNLRGSGGEVVRAPAFHPQVSVTRPSPREKSKSQRSADSLPWGKLAGWVKHIGQGADH